MYGIESTPLLLLFSLYLELFLLFAPFFPTISHYHPFMKKPQPALHWTSEI